MMRLPWRGKSVPHAVFDIVRGCNCRCRNCYNAAQPKVKALDAIKAEMRVIRAERNVTAVSLSGGEPLLHPQIDAIITYLSREERVAVNTLTNGILFDDAMAKRLKDAGLDFVTLHIQKGQTRPDCDDSRVEALRREKGQFARAHGLFPALVETIDAEDGAGFAALGRFLRSAPEFEYALVTVARDFRTIDPAIAEPPVDRKPMLDAFADAGYLPSVFIGGRYNRNLPRWYVLQSVQAVDRDGRERAWNRIRPGLLERLFLYGYALICNRSIHWVKSTSAKTKVRLLLNGLTGGRLSTFLFALRATLAGWTVREKHIIVQYPPQSLGDGKVEYCDNCPDASAESGRLRPLCLSDVPLPEESTR
ncbi:MAG: radical SAM protein [Kiritimatiellae bacterium]|nr:radical SAM protein [Kiritimatiellia bacterium]